MTDTVGKTAAPKGGAEPSLWSPLGQPTFALLWTAMVVSTTGSWMHETGAGWLMTTLTSDPARVALVQTANTAPIFLFVLLAGALADRLDKRRFLITINLVMAALVLVFAGLVHAELITADLLILFTFVIGTGAAFSAPAWQALMPDLVDRHHLKSALALNSLAINISRAIGPALAGVLIASVSMSAPFLFNACSFLVIVTALILWRPTERRANKALHEPLWSSIATGVRHASHNQPLTRTLWRAVLFFFPASALWALLPSVVRGVPDASASVFGMMTGAIGAGAVLGAVLLPRIRQRLSSSQLVVVGSLLLSAVLLALAVLHFVAALLIICAMAGLAWIAVLTSLNLSAQIALPAWVRARGLSVFLMTFFGAMTVGSVFWGQLARAVGTDTTMMVAGGLLAGLAIAARSISIGDAEGLDMTPAMQWPAPTVALADTAELADGAVMVTVSYHLPEDNIEPFLGLMAEQRRARYSSGAFDWGLQRDFAEPNVWMEWFRVGSWEEHLLQHDRVTVSEQAVSDRIDQLLEPDRPKEVRHWVAPVRSWRLLEHSNAN